MAENKEPKKTPAKGKGAVTATAASKAPAKKKSTVTSKTAASKKAVGKSAAGKSAATKPPGCGREAPSRSSFCPTYSRDWPSSFRCFWC